MKEQNIKSSKKSNKIIVRHKRGILSIAGKYAHKKPITRININKIRNYINYNEA